MARAALASTMRAYSGCTLLPRPITSCKLNGAQRQLLYLATLKRSHSLLSICKGHIVRCDGSHVSASCDALVLAVRQ